MRMLAWYLIVMWPAAAAMAVLAILNALLPETGWSYLIILVIFAAAIFFTRKWVNWLYVSKTEEKILKWLKVDPEA